MKKDNKTSATGFFRYFKSFIGNRIYVYIFLNIMIGFFDGLGLAMFIPLISIATGTINENSDSLGKMKFVIDFLKSTGFELNLFTSLTLMVSLFILKGIFYYIKLNYLNRTQLLALTKIRFSLVEGLKNVSYEGFTKLDAGKIQNNMVGETGKLITAMSQYFTTLQNLILVITYVVMAFVSSWKFAIMVGIGGMVTNVLYLYINRYIKAYSKAAIEYAHVFNSNLIQTVNNFKYLKATNAIKIFEKKLKENILITENLGYKTGRVSYIGESLREPLIIIVIAAVIYLQVKIFHNDFGAMMVSLLLFYRALSYLVSMQSSWSAFLRSSVGVESVENLVADFVSEKETVTKRKILHIGDISVKDISVTYGNKKILDQVSLEIPEKTSAAFVGESGAGKTTLANVVCGLLYPHEGTVLSENESVYDSDLSSYREKTGYITQEAVIFDDSIFNNVTFWSAKTQEALSKFNRVIEMVSLSEFLNNLPDKEDTRLGNNGILVSGGQKQRISIARELYKDVELLIMDEATSALDSETEKYIKENIDMLHGNFTMVIIAHRLSTIRNVDTIYVMENGKIIDSGSYEELIKKSVKFKKMVALQSVN